MRQSFPCKKTLAGVVALFFIFFWAASLPAQNGEGRWEGWFTGIAQVTNAKRMAMENNRPLLTVVSSGPCAHCNSLYDILLTDTFRAFAAQHQIVLFSCADSPGLPYNLADLYKQQCDMISVYPHIYIFEIKEGADLTTADAKSLNDEFVHLLDAGEHKPNRYSGFNYTPGRRINNIQLEEESNWTPETFIQVFKSFFPNANGVELVPGSTHTGYENAFDFGRIPNINNPPPSAEEWIKKAEHNRLTPTSTQNWFKFQGDLGKRYVFSATGIENSNPGVEVTFELFRSELKDNKWVPLRNAHQTITPTGFDALDRGIQVDMPAGTATNQTYFVRISAAKSINATYTLRVHEAPRAPAAGSVTNPHWTDAKPGQWTMNRGAAEAAAKANDKPVIYLFGGLLWNAESVCIVHKVLQTQNFKNATTNTYLVVLDNRERDGTGPSLLRDNTAGGYLKTNTISEIAAAAKLADNIAVQDALALPGAGGKIDYPTLVYRVRKANDLVSVGRISKDYNAATVIAKLNDLKAMAWDGFVEDNNYADLTTQVLEDGVQKNSRIGGSLITADWWKFNVPADHQAVTITAIGDLDGAIISLAVYAANNTETPLKTATGAAGKSVSLDFAPTGNPGGNRNPTAPEYLLQVTSTGTAASFPYTLELVEKAKSYVLAMADQEIKVSKQNVMDGRPVDLRLNIDTFTGNEKDITFNCRLLSQDGMVLRLQKITIPHGDKATPYTFNITLPKNIEYPNGAITELIAEIIESDEDGNCQIDPEQSTTVINVYGYATFDYPQEATIDLYKNIAITPGTLCFPIIGGSANGESVSYDPASVPPGLLVHNLTNDPNNPRIEITGTPANEAKAQYTLYLILMPLMQYIDLTFNIKDLPPVSRAFAGYLVEAYDDAAEAKDIRGDIKIDNELDDPAGRLMVRVATQDTIAPSLFRFTAWSSYSPGSPGKQGSVTLTGKASYDDSTLVLQVCLDDGTCTGTYTSPLGNSFAIHAKAVTEEQGQYAGYYTVALREADTTTRSFRGWLQVWVDDDGLATYSSELIDGTAFGPETTYITPGELLFGHQSDVPNGELTFFLPLGWQEKNGKYSYPGRLAGRLSIVSLAERQQQSIVFPWISVCDDDYYSVWEKSANDSILLAPCGTVFESTLPVAEQVNPPNPPNFYIKVEPAPPETSFAPGTALPNYVKLEENRDASTMEVVDEGGILSAELGDLEYDADQGTFFGTINILKTADGSANGELARTPCTIRGILTPNTSCCSVDTLDVGYGYFIDDGTTYLVTISTQEPWPAAAPTLVDLEGQTGPDFNYVFHKKAVALTIYAHTRKILHRNTNLDGTTSLRLYDWTWEGGGFLEFLLTTRLQQFVGLEDGKPESAILEIPLTPAEAVATFAVPDADGHVPDGATAVQPCWNLLCVPWDIKLAADCVLERGCMTYDAGGQTFVPATSLSTGNAFWVFLNIGERFTLWGKTLGSLAEPTFMEGWNFIAGPWDEGYGTRWFWEDGHFTTEPPMQPAWQGVWYYYQP